jgi:hypothetical protein
MEVPAPPPARERRWRERFPFHGLVAFCLATLAALPAIAGSGGPPRISPEASISQRVGVSEVELRYSRPAVRGRTVWGDLVPWDQVWRTGANEATTLTLSHDGTFQGQKVEAGTYALFTIPGKRRWTLILNRNTDQWGSFEYRPQQDVLRVSAEPRPAPPEERLTFIVPEVTAETVRFELRWAGLAVPFEVSFDTSRLAREEARRQTSRRPNDTRLAWSWAYYFYKEGINPDQALDLAARAARESQVYWTWSLKARLLAQTGRYPEAVQAAVRALEYGTADLETSSEARSDMEYLRTQISEWKAGGS